MSLSSPPVIVSLNAIPVRLPRDLKSATGSAGSPSVLQPGEFAYRWSSTVRALYSTYFETCLVKVELSNGLVGWGEAQAPLAPRVAATIVEDLLRPILIGQPFDGTREKMEWLWDEMYASMRVRGQTGGFMLDAMAGVDIALWDLAGKLHDKSVSRLIAGDAAKQIVPAYLSGLTGATLNDKLEFAAKYYHAGFRLFKLFHDSDVASLLELMDALRAKLGPDAQFAVDALWRLDWHAACEFDRELETRNTYWFEAPLMPEDAVAHKDLNDFTRTPLALGESYRTTFEMEPFFERGAFKFLQPDLGRTGITGGLRLAARAAELGMEVVPHVSIAMAPQIAAALHFAAAASACRICEYNPAVVEIANRYSSQAIAVEGANYRLTDAPGLGVTVNEEALRKDIVR